ncbi:unnamed protein product [Rhizoctonia solani]|uniref:Peptidase S8/S53 domain-containing protein n=1 Tax=Rhizoctonia solani TaxID=456999 RepID=A0A8H3CC98_9AGAM|nr:unnamed protein product [Rhizoctonia solani]
MSQPPDSVDIDQSELDDVSKTYIVILKSDDNGLDSEDTLDKHWDWVKERDNNGLDSGPEWCDVHKYECKYLSANRTTLAKLSESAIEDLKKREEVVDVVQDRFGTLDMNVNQPANIASANNAPWNLQRLSSTAPLGQNADPAALTFTYRRPEVAGLAAKPVHVYILDTGIITNHQEFQGRQVFQGPNYSQDQTNNHDTHGHGTHVAGTVGGNQCGVARNPGVRITGVKVTTGHGLIDGGRAVRLSAVIRGLQWVSEQHRANPEVPAIINMSLRYVPGDDALDQFVDRVVAQDMHVVVSAGNAGQDATSQSPARARGALAVGGSTIRDGLYVNSNFGPKVAIFAPGVGIVSAGIETPAELVSKTGTSMASPLVAGTIAWLIQQEGNRSPQAMLRRLQELAGASGRVVAGVPANTTNQLIWNGVQ